MPDRALPSVAKALRVKRWIKESYAACVYDVAEAFGMSHRSARRYVEWLHKSGFIYQKYRANKRIYYSVIRRN